MFKSTVDSNDPLTGILAEILISAVGKVTETRPYFTLQSHLNSEHGLHV